MPKSHPLSSAPLKRCGTLISLLCMIACLVSVLAPTLATADETPSRAARVIYHFTEANQLDGSMDFGDRECTTSSVCSGEMWVENDLVAIRANAFPAALRTSSDPAVFRVIEDYASTSATGKGAHDITQEASYDGDSGIVSLPKHYADADLTVVWYVPSDQQNLEIPLDITISKTIEGISSQAELSHVFSADTQVIDLKLFDNEELAARVKNITITQGGSKLTQYIYQNGSISLSASPLGGPISLSLDDETEAVTTREDAECAVNSEPPLFALFSAANPAVGERFTIDPDSALIRTCEPGGNMAQVMGWPEKSGTYGFAVHFNHCSNPEVVNADQNHIAPGGTVRTPGGGTYDYNWVKGLHFAWGDCYGDVDNNGAGEPKVQSGWVEVTNVDYATQTVSYRFFLDVCSDIDGHNMQSIMGTFQVHENMTGYLEIKKQSALPDTSANNACYSLEGAQYGIYTDADCTNLKATLTTDAQGCARSKALPVATYYLKELSAPAGFAIDAQAHEVKVVAGTTKTATLDEVPQSDNTPLLLAKHDTDHAYDANHNNVQGGASSFEGAEFTISFHPTIEDGYAKVDPLRTWVVKTDEHGVIDLRKGEGCKLSGDDFYRDSTGAITLPIGTYEIRETKAPLGYMLNDSVIVRKVTGMPNGNESLSSYDPPIVSDDVIRGGVELEKRDAESGLQSALGTATLDGTTFSITNDNPHEVCVEGIFYQPGEVCATLSVSEGKAATAADALPYGNYTIRELQAGDGYTTSDSAPRSFSIKEDGKLIRFSDSAEDAEGGAFKNHVKRGDLNFIKVRERDGQRLAGVPFKITSQTTGESHIVVSDSNGTVDTSSTWIEHTHNTNGNDNGDYDADRGVWFGQTKNGTITEVHNELGALPFDTYELEELPCEANEGLKLIRVSFTIYRDQQHLDFGVVENQDQIAPWISTVASDSIDHDKLLHADEHVTINDHIRYGNLNEGTTYTLRASLVDKSTGEHISETAGETVFTAAAGTGTTEVSIPVNLADVASSDVVVYETLLQDDNIILEHHELDNSEQTVSIIQPRIATTAIDAADGDNDVLNESEAHIIDTVNYTNLIPGEAYTLTGTLMKKEGSEEEDYEAVALADSEGNTLTSTTTFTPQNSSGSAEVTFSFDASAIDPHTELVVFEELRKGEVIIATHEDPDDKDQTIRIIEPEEPPVPFEQDAPSDPNDNTTPEERTNFFAKTGSAVLPLLIGFGVLFGVASVFIGIAYRQHRKAQAVTAAIAHNMLGSKDPWRP